MATTTNFDELRRTYDVRRRTLTAILNQVGLPPLNIDGSYFLLANISKQPFTSDTAFCKHLIQNIGVAAIPPSYFYANPKSAPALARFCFAKLDATLAEAGERLAKL